MLFSKDDKNKLILLLEIQSSLVRGSLVLFTGQDIPAILFTQSMDLPHKPHAGTAYYLGTTFRDLKEMIKNMLVSLYKISHDATAGSIPKQVSEVHYVLSSPWIVSQARTISVSFDKKTIITEETVNKILADERQNMDIDKKIEVDTIEEKIFDVRVNGYSIGAWRGKEAVKLEISYALSVGSKNSIERLRETALSGAHAKKVYFHSSLLLQYLSLRNSVIKDDSYTLVHVHGELTDLVVVKNRYCSFFGSFPFGTATVTRKIAEATETDMKTAESLLSLYLGRHIEESHKKKIDLIAHDLSESWAGELRKLLSGGGIDAGGVDTVFIIARAHEDFFVESFHAAMPRAKIGKLSVDMVSNYAIAIYDIMK